MNILEALKEMILQLGVGGIFTATALEYGCFPISSEILLPFIGYAVANSQIGLIPAILAATIGGMVGSLGCYFIGYIGCGVFGRLAFRFQSIAIGVDRAQRFFLRYGNWSVFLARLLPIARTYISFPAGMAKMPLFSFLIYTALGAFLWNSALISGGYFLGNHWNRGRAFIEGHPWIPYLCFLILFFAIRKIWKKKRKA